MKKFYLTLLFFTILISNSFCQILDGKIVDNENKPVPYTTVYVKEIKFGTVSNEFGQFRLKLNTGSYTIVFQCLGFETLEKKVSISEGENHLNITLNPKSYQLKGVSVKPGSEDPSYPIIRKAIGMAPFYQNQVKEFDAEVYMKGSIKVIKLSWIVKRAMRDEKDAPKEGDLFLQESLNNIHFAAPDKYTQNVKMIRSNFPSDESNNDAMQFINASLYQPEIGDIILPLSPFALNHYKFRYEGYSNEGDRIINKIKVIPRRKSKQLVEGYIYIADKYWNIHSADLTVESLVGTIRIQQTFGEVEKNVWLPINHNFDIIGKFMGNEGNIKYVSSVKYKSVVINTDLKTPNNFVSQNIQQKIDESKTQQVSQAKKKNNTQIQKDQKRKEKIDKLLEKNELSNKDMYQLAKLMEKDAKESDTTRKGLEIKETHNVKVDSLARKADTTQWNKIRPIALTTDEVNGMENLRKSVEKKDSVNSKKDTLDKKPSLFKIITLGYSKYDNKSKQFIDFSGLLNVEQFRFNTVDGFVTGLSLNYNKMINNHRYSINPQLAYAINRKVPMGRLSGGLSYSPLRRGYIGFTGGSESVDFNRESGVNVFGNTVASLAFRTNYMKLYEHHYGEIYNKIDIMNGFDCKVSFGYYDRRMLNDVTDFSFYPSDKKSYTPNLPVKDTIFGKYTPDHQAFIAKLSFSFTPEYYYRIRDNRKYMVSSKYPTFILDIKSGVPNFLGSDVKFLQIEGSIKQNIQLGASDRLSYTLSCGDFVANDKLYFPDYKHFNTQEIPVVVGSFVNGFQLLEYYKHSTDSQYAQGFVSYTSPYLVLKYLPWVSNRMWLENVYISSLCKNGSKPYWELGYSITQISLLGGVGVFVGFEGQKYMGFGIKASFAIHGEISI